MFGETTIDRTIMVRYDEGLVLGKEVLVGF